MNSYMDLQLNLRDRKMLVRCLDLNIYCLHRVHTLVCSLLQIAKYGKKAHGNFNETLMKVDF